MSIILSKPLNLSETETFLQHKNIFLDRYQILQIYMAMGGIPHYLDEVELLFLLGLVAWLVTIRAFEFF